MKNLVILFAAFSLGLNAQTSPQQVSTKKENVDAKTVAPASKASSEKNNNETVKKVSNKKRVASHVTTVKNDKSTVASEKK